MSNNILSFSQNFSNSIALTASPGATTHLIPWEYIGIEEPVQLYSYDSYNSANKWYINLLKGTIENEFIGSTSLKYLSRTHESVNLTNFFCTDIKVSLNTELNQYYKLENLYVSETSSINRNILCTEIDSNNYYFRVDNILSISDPSRAFRFTLKYRENLDNNISSAEIRHDPRYTELIKIQLNGSSRTYNLFNLSSNTIDLRQYSKRIYIKDGTEHGYLKYDKINKKYQSLAGLTAGVNTTTFEFNIIESSLYNIKVEVENTVNSVVVPELKIRGGKFTCSVADDSLASLNEVLTVEYCELYLHESELDKVPNKSEILVVRKAA